MFYATFTNISAISFKYNKTSDINVLLYEHKTRSSILVAYCYACNQKVLKITKWQSVVTNRRRTDNTIVKRRGTKRITTIYNPQYRNIKDRATRTYRTKNRRWTRVLRKSKQLSIERTQSHPQCHNKRYGKPKVQ